MWIRTRWGSLYKFLERFIKLRVVCLNFSSFQSLISVTNRELTNLSCSRMQIRTFQTYLGRESTLTSS